MLPPLPPGVTARAQKLVAGGADSWQGWDWQLSTGVWHDPAIGVLNLPNVLRTDWETLATGNNIRFTKALHTLPGSASDWTEQHRAGISGNIFLESWSASKNLAATITASMPTNGGIFTAFYPPLGLGKMSGLPILEVGWGSSGSGVYAAVGSWGDVRIFRNGNQVGLLRPQAGDGGGIGEAVCSMLLLPFGGNKLLVRTSWGGSGVQEIEAITPTNSSVITSSGNLWWRFPNGRPSMQVARMRFGTGGTLYSKILTLSEAPLTGRSFTRFFADGTQAGAFVGVPGITIDEPSAVVSVVDATTLSPWVANGIRSIGRLKVVLSGGLDWSPVVDAVCAKMLAEVSC